ncbi:hypothetical protein EGW08_021105 [Elysia chlorotica]|uniref:Amidohydrolase-related domain-containing protein n=1 Tax=Elysia chlorotica TaxID=188477 RepID=A0A433SPJ8_ELYCH|nr:hypothetical protein EGW08_021105 [Elysia chlorotica]
MELMQDLAKIATEHSLPIQTHISENREEVKMIAGMYPQSKNYTDVYVQAGLLGDKTILAHGVYLSDLELEVIRTRGSGISHCPNSNFSLKSGILDVRKVMKAGVKLGLGTDFAGGHSPSMLDALRRGVTAANIYSFSPGFEPGEPLVTYRDLFRLATLGSAQVLGISDVVGNFEVGKQFDGINYNNNYYNSDNNNNNNYIYNYFLAVMYMYFLTVMGISDVVGNFEVGKQFDGINYNNNYYNSDNNNNNNNNNNDIYNYLLTVLGISDVVTTSDIPSTVRK